MPSHTNSAFSLEAWVRPDSLTSATIASKYDSRFVGGSSWSLGTTPDGKVEFLVYQTNGPIPIYRGVTTAQPVLAIGEWRHVAATVNVKTQVMDIYINGVRAATAPTVGSQSITSVVDSATPMRIGAIYASGTFTGLTHFWDGLVDEVSLYNKDLFASEVQALYGRNLGGHFLTGNYIGTDLSGALSLGNAGDGVHIFDSTGNNIGSIFAGFGNTIARNVGAGVTVAGGAGNAIQTNRIFANGSLGIDLGGDGVTTNDSLDNDAGANHLQNFPQLQSAILKPYGIDISGTLAARPSESYTLQFFASETCDVSGHGEGAAALGSANVTTNAAGTVPFVAALVLFSPVAPFITATATDAAGNTSEFSTCRISRPELIGDVDGNRRVDLRDLATLLGRLGQTTNLGPSHGDLNSDGVINRTDAALLALNFGRGQSTPAPSAPAPVVNGPKDEKAVDLVLTAHASREAPPAKLRVLRAGRSRIIRPYAN
jgi:hypothetical protein